MRSDTPGSLSRDRQSRPYPRAGHPARMLGKGHDVPKHRDLLRKPGAHRLFQPTPCSAHRAAQRVLLTPPPPHTGSDGGGNERPQTDPLQPRLPAGGLCLLSTPKLTAVSVPADLACAAQLQACRDIILHYLIVRCVLTLCIVYVTLYYIIVTLHCIIVSCALTLLCCITSCYFVARCALTSHCIMLRCVTLYHRGSQLALHLISVGTVSSLRTPAESNFSFNAQRLAHELTE